MAYTTDAIIRSESPFKSATKIVTATMTRVIAQADNFIDGKIGGVYLLPLASTPAMIQEISTTLATYNLIKDQNLNIEIASGVNLTQMMEDVLALLDQIKDRKLKLFTTLGVELDLVSTIKVGFYPNDADTESKDAPRLFDMTQAF
ncbi:MAG: phage protein Gp36 family protein [Nitrosomonadaceae bacterium]